jgi:pilus assembly protein CpaF
MVLMAALELPDRAIREQTASALHLIIQLSRMKDGVRRVTHITEVTGMEGQIITLQDLFKFEQTGVGEDGAILGSMMATGIRPTFSERFESAGVALPADLFMAGTRR